MDVLFLLLALVAWDDAQPTDLWKTHAGYRQNGLDLDDDFLPGEAGVDDTVCDNAGGTTGSNGAYVEDFDGDTVNERQWFVVSSVDTPTGWSAGTDNGTCGPPGSPCASISQVHTNIAANNVSNPDGTGEVVMCIGGTFEDSALVGGWPYDGNAGVKTMAQGTYSINEGHSFEYPSNPSMILGIDADDDGNYPPADPDDSAGFRTTSMTASTPGDWWLMIDAENCNRCEVAHFTIDSWGTNLKEGRTITRQPGGSSYHEHQYLHDLDIDDFGEGQCHASGTIVHSMFSSNRGHFSHEFSRALRVTGYWERGGYHADAGQARKHRMRGLRITAEGGGRPTNVNALGATCANAGGQDGILKRTWDLNGGSNAGFVTSDLEYVDNHISFSGWYESRDGDGDVGPGLGNAALGLALCGTRNVYFQGNRVEDFEGCTWVGPTVEDNICTNNGTTQRTGDIYVRRNQCVATTWTASEINQSRFRNFQVHGGSNQSGNAATTSGYEGDLVLEDNEWDARIAGTVSDRFGSLLAWQEASNGEHTGARVTIQNNDILGCFDRNVGVLFWNVVGATATNTPDYMRILGNNVFIGPGCTAADPPMVTIVPSQVADFLADSNQTNHCEWNVNGTNYTSDVTLNALSGWSNNSCAGTIPTVDNYQSGAGTVDPLGGGGGGAGPFTLTVTLAGAGTGQVTSSPTGVTCGGDCTEDYADGTSVTLTAVPQAGSSFTGWSGVCSGTGNCVVSMTQARGATATFATVGPGWQRQKLKFLRNP